MFETRWEGPSPIADPDLMMVDPEKYNARSAPNLRGIGLPADVLSDMYAGVVERVVGK
jgi:hypothetical protein